MSLDHKVFGLFVIFNFCGEGWVTLGHPPAHT